MFKFKSKFWLIITPILVVSLLSIGFFTWQKDFKKSHLGGQGGISAPNRSNQQIQSLIADSEHEVAVIEECDLAVRFPKKVTVPQEFLGYDILKQELIIASYNHQQVFTLRMEKSGEFLTIRCNNFTLQSKEIANFDRYLPDFLTKFNFKIATTQIDGGSSFIQVQHFFTKENKNYTITDLQREKNFSHESLSRLFGVQLQPNSPAPSTLSIKL